MYEALGKSPFQLRRPLSPRDERGFSPKSRGKCLLLGKRGFALWKGLSPKGFAGLVFPVREKGGKLPSLWPSFASREESGRDRSSGGFKKGPWSLCPGFYRCECRNVSYLESADTVYLPKKGSIKNFRPPSQEGEGVPNFGKLGLFGLNSLPVSSVNSDHLGFSWVSFRDTCL